MPSLSWMLVFPPLIHSNWGNYYPSIALLAAALDAVRTSAGQLDLNEAFLDYLIAPERLARIAGGDGYADPDSAECIPTRAAAELLIKSEFAIADAAGRHLPPEQCPGLELATELARAYHIDLPVRELVRPEFAASKVAQMYERFFDASEFDAMLRRTEHALAVSVPMGPQLGPAVLLARRAKRLRPDIRVVFGGPTMTLMDDATLTLLLDEVPEIDAVVRYEGEGPIQCFAEQLRDGEWAPEKIANAHSRHAQARQSKNTIRLRDVPSAIYAPELMAHLAAPRLSVQQARGCYWGECAYCDFIELYNSGLRYDGQSAEGLVEEVRKFVQGHRAGKFWLVTEALPPRVGLRFAKRILEEGLKIDWRSFAMVDRAFTTDILATMRESGCSSLTIGMESMTTRVLQNVRKKATAEDNVAFLEAVRAAGMRIDLNLIPDLPTTTAQEAFEGLAQVEAFEDVYRVVSVFPFEATRSSDIGRNPTHYGLTVEGAVAPDPLHPKGQAQFSSNRLVYRDDGMSHDERAEVFAAYRALARRVSARNAATGPDASAGVALCSPRTAILEGRDNTILYSWDQDRYWTVPGALRGLLTWLRDERRPIMRSDIANFLYRTNQVPLAALPFVTDSIVESLAQMAILRLPQQASVH